MSDSTTPGQSRLAGPAQRISRSLLLAPEGALFVVALSIYAALGATPALVVLMGIAALSFAVRASALHLGRLALERARYREADALLHVALFLNPWSADALALRGTLALVTGAPEAAESALRRALALMPNQPAFHAALSGALLDLGRGVEAAHSARRALRLDPDYAIGHLYLAEAERASGAPPSEVEDRLRAGLRADAAPEATAALNCALAAHLFAEGRAAEGTLALHAVEALLPRCSIGRQAALRYHLGELLLANGQVERAREYFQGVELLDPQGRYGTAAWRGARLSQ